MHCARCLLRAEIYPDSTNEAVGKCFHEGDSGLYDRVEYRYNRVGEVVRKKDQNETVHEYEVEPFHPYLDLGGSPAEVRCGRLAVDRVTILGPGIDAAVRRIETQHDLLGRVATITSFDAPDGGSAVNQVVREYTGFGRLAREYQEHSGVKHAGTLYAKYDYAGASSGLRPVSLRYPNGRLLHYTYGTTDSAADVLGRLDAICDDNAGNPGATLAQYTYLGLGTVVIEDYAEPQVKLDLWGGTSRTYQGFDPFGRIVDHLWRDYGASTDADRIQHGYDRASSRLWRANPVAAAQAPAVYLDELYQYDGVSQLVDLQRGQLNANKDAILSKVFAEDWSLDATGNWTAFRQDLGGNGTWDLDQARGHTKANEVTSASSWATPSHDRAGNMVTLPKPASPADAFGATFDAWNRMVKVEDGQDTVAEYQYTPDNRRAVKKTYSGGALAETRHFYYTDDWQTIEERTASGGAIAADPDTQYVWGDRYIDALVLRDRDTTANGTLDERLYALHDANFNVTALINRSGDVVERFTYTAYGTVEVRDAAYQPTAAASAYAWPYTYTTRPVDTETRLTYYRARYYHAGLGRFVSRDPIEYWSEDFNLYGYCSNSPVDGLDPYGLFEGLTWCQFPQQPKPWGIPPDYPVNPGLNVWIDPDMELCEKICAWIHEMVHVMQQASCCQRAIDAFGKARLRQRVFIMGLYQQWENFNRDIWECSAYKASQLCSQAQVGLNSLLGECCESAEDNLKAATKRRQEACKAAGGRAPAPCPDFARFLGGQGLR